MNRTEEAGESECHAARAAADFQDLHGLGVFALADVLKVVQDLFFERDPAGLEELCIGPLGLARDYVMAGVFARAPVPIAPHPEKLSVGVPAPPPFCFFFVLFCATIAH